MRTIQTCPKCTAEFEVVKVKVSPRNSDSFECQCQHSLGSWNGSRFRSYRLTKPGVEQPITSWDAVPKTVTANQSVWWPFYSPDEAFEPLKLVLFGTRPDGLCWSNIRAPQAGSDPYSILCVEWENMTPIPIATLAEFDALNLRELLAGYHAAENGEAEPFHRSRSYWHGWRLWKMNLGKLTPRPEDIELTARLRLRREERDV